jgi:hypothetical protein
VELGSSKYHHQDGGIPNAAVRLFLLDHGSMVNERDTSIFLNLAGSLPMNYTTSRLGLPRRGINKYRISSPG